MIINRPLFKRSEFALSLIHILYGAIGQTEYIVKKMKEESGYKNAYVIATGGLGKIIADETECIDLYDPQLTLNGLRMIHEKVQKKR